MRKILKKTVITWLLIVGGLSSCSILDVDIPDNLIKDDYWQTKDQVKASLTGVYTSLHSNLTQFIKWGDLRSEIYDYGTKSGLDNEVQFVKQDITTTNGLASWAKVYEGINWANSFLKNARSTMQNDPSITEQEMASWESEVYAIRALYYFYLVRTFKDVPLSLEVYESDLQSPYSGASSETVVLDSIEVDLTKALAHAPENFTNPRENHGKITKNAVRAIWADVKLWRGDNDGCIALCEELEEIYDSKMVHGDAWFTIFSQGNSTETIFEYQYINSQGVVSPLYVLYGLGTNNVFASNYTYLQNRMSALFPPISEEHSLSDTIRIIDATITTTGEITKYTVSKPYYPIEYRGVDGRDANFIFYRFREILLIKAEALAMKELYTEAVETINKIRKATLLPEIEDPANYGEGESFFMNLLDERIGELAYEGKQWFSLVRIARNTEIHSLLIERIAAAAEFTVPDAKLQTMRARVLDPESWFLPYLKSEVENNPLLKQKAYYEGK